MARGGTAERGARLVLCAIAGALLVQIGLMAAYRATDLDEPQYLHEGWLAAQGLRPYADFWVDHGPLAPLVFSLGYRAAPLGDAAALRLNRGLALLLLLLSAELVRRLARDVRPDDGVFAALAVLLFAASPLVAARGFEVRADVLLQPIWLLALLLWLRAARSGTPRAFAAAGLALGTGFLATQKTAMLGVAAGGMFALWMASRRQLAPGALLAYAAASLGVLALLCAYEAARGSFAPFFDFYVVDSARARIPAAVAVRGLRALGPLAPLLAIGALLVVAAEALRRRLPLAVAALAACAALLVVQYVYLLPVHVVHALLPAAGPFALVVAWALQRCVLGGGAAPGAWRHAALVAFACAIAIDAARARRYDPAALARQLAGAERTAALVPPDALLFDGDAWPIARQRPLYARAFPLVMQAKLRSPAALRDVVAELDRRDVGWWEVDSRSRPLDRGLAPFRAANYVALGPMLFVAGRVVPASASGEAELPIRIAGSYHWRIGGRDDAALFVDGAPAANPIALADGVHRVAWAGGGTLVLALAAPEAWPPALRGAAQVR